MSVNSRNYNFIVGLPRSGSTLLAALLNQNPRFHASGTSAAQPVFNRMFKHFSEAGEVDALLTDVQKTTLLKGCVENVHAHVERAETIFDTNRNWLARVDQLTTVFPLSRFIVCVRNPADILDSFEKIHRADPLRTSKMFSPEHTRQQRIDRLLADDGLVGRALALVRDVLTGPHAERMVIIDYAAFMERPDTTLSLLYASLREEAFTHDLENFSFDLPSLDAFLGAPGLHRVSGPLRPPMPERLISAEERRRAEALAFWKAPFESEANFLFER